MHGEETNPLKIIPVYDGKQFYHDLVSENCGDGKKLWQALNGY